MLLQLTFILLIPASWGSASGAFAGCSSAVTSPLPSGWHTGSCTEGKVLLWHLFQPLVSHHSPFLAVSYTQIVWVGVLTLVLWCAGTCFIDLTAWLGLEGNQILQDHVQASFGYLQMRHHSLSGQSVPALCHLQRHFPSYSHGTSCIALCACCPFSCWWAPLRRFWPSPLQGEYLLFKECVFSFSQSIWERSSYP